MFGQTIRVETQGKDRYGRTIGTLFMGQRNINLEMVECRCSDLVNMELSDVMLSDRSGFVTFRYGKGSKQRSVPLPLAARRALAAYLETRPPVKSNKVFIGERGPLTERGFRALCDKYSARIGIKLQP